MAEAEKAESQAADGELNVGDRFVCGSCGHHATVALINCYRREAADPPDSLGGPRRKLRVMG